MEKLTRGMRIIPAYAGSTIHQPFIFRPVEDHPRIRGVHKDIIYPAIQPIGSSPHTRGPLRILHRCIIVHRIIPAYAGSTTDVIASGSRSEDHPRIRGVHSMRVFSSYILVGSSPHTRGPLLQRLCFRPLTRIIPAYAGSTILVDRVKFATQDHPRIRGVHCRN